MAAAGLVLIAGALHGVAFTPPRAWLACATLAVLWFACTFVPWWGALWLGWLFGLAAFATGTGWLHEVLGLPVLALMCAAAAAFPAVACALGRALAPSARAPFAIAGCWVGAEALRLRTFGGHPWIELGLASLDGAWAAVFPWAGTSGASLALAALAALIAVGARCWRSARWIGAGATGAALAVLPAWATSPTGTSPDGTLRVGIVQGAVEAREKWSLRGQARSMARYRDGTRALHAEHPGLDLVVWPESVLSLRDARRTLRRAAEDGPVLAGVPIAAPHDRQWNAAVLVHPDGSEQRYRRRRLVPHAERPLAEWTGPLAGWVRFQGARIEPGPAEQPAMVLAGREIGISICHESLFARDVRERTGAWLASIANDGWFEPGAGPEHHLVMVRARAAETGRHLVRAANTGVSAWIGPRGDVRQRLPRREVTHDARAVELRTGETAYMRFGDTAAWLAAAVLAAGACVRRRSRPN